MTPSSPGKASVTVVIPAFNEEANIARLTQQVLGEPWDDTLVLDEIIIVDDCSDDDTQAITEALAGEHQHVRVMRHAQRSGKNAAMRTGLAACHSDIIAFVDSDVRLAPRCLTQTIHCLIDDPALTGSSCIIKPLPSRSWRERASRFQALLVTELRRHEHRSLARVYALRTDPIRALALPDTFYDDLYIMRWLRHHDYRYMVCADATAYIRSATGLRDFAKQTLRTWHAEQALAHVMPDSRPVPGGRRVTAGAIASAAFREPLGFVLYVLWRGVIMSTPRTLWLPAIDHSRYDTSTSTKDLGV